MNEKTGTGVSSEKENVKESQSRSVTPSLDTPIGCRVGASQLPSNIKCYFLPYPYSTLSKLSNETKIAQFGVRTRKL